MPKSPGFAIIPRWLLYAPDVTAHAKLVYVVLQSHTGKHATAFPTVRRIADEAGIGQTSVRNAIAELTAMGLLDIRRRRRRDGGQASNEYTLRTTI